MTLLTGRTSLLRLVIAVLLVLSAALFTTGVLLEHGTDTHTTSQHTETSEGVGEHSEEGEQAHSEEGESGHTDEKTILGIPADSPFTVGGAILASLLLAAAVWKRPTTPILVTAGVFAAGAAVLDVLEALHQIEEDQTGIAVLAGLIAVLHLAIALAAVCLWAENRRIPALA